MSSLLEVIGWMITALGAYMTWRDGRRLLSSRASGRGSSCSTQRTRNVRRKAWHDIRFSLFYVVIGVGWATSWYKHWPYLWFWGTYIVVLMSWEIGAWLRSRRRKSGSQAAATH
jgi:hypothetical protein